MGVSFCFFCSREADLAAASPNAELLGMRALLTGLGYDGTCTANGADEAGCSAFCAIM